MKWNKFLPTLSPEKQMEYMLRIPTTTLVDLRFAQQWCVLTGEWPTATLKALRYAVSTKAIRNEGRVLNIRTGKLCPSKRRIQVRLHSVRAYVARRGLK